jgi:predicted nucleotidyltransferase
MNEGKAVINVIDISVWMQQFLRALQDTFADRVWFVGLQGSYGRGEATNHSDIDVVLILDVLSAEDLRAYEAMLDTLPHRERICGFVSGKAELLSWEPSDLFQFYYDTKPIKGTLDELLPLLDSAAVDRAIRIGACNLYHGCVHNMLHEKSDDVLKGLYKSASFMVQAIVYRLTGRYVRQQKDLLTVALPEEREIIETFLHLKNGGSVDFDAMSQTLFAWARQWIKNTRGCVETAKMSNEEEKRI